MSASPGTGNRCIRSAESRRILRVRGICQPGTLWPTAVVNPAGAANRHGTFRKQGSRRRRIGHEASATARATIPPASKRDYRHCPGIGQGARSARIAPRSPSSCRPTPDQRPASAHRDS
ncbi:MAG: DUF1589 domain-containing protein [Candidatus Zixiibacteriota bacterium]